VISVEKRRDQEPNPAAPEVVVRGLLDFDTFYRTEFRRVLGLVGVLSGSRWAEEMTQEAFLRAYRDWGTVGRMDRPDAWVRVAAMNLARSAFRRRRAEARALLRLGEPVTVLPDLEPRFADFWQQVRKLPARQAQVVALHYLEDRPVAEIAEILGIASGTVKAQLHTARTTLADRLRATLKETS
jgi:RNA polymerase sigma-70 factor (ECF subfamily)